MLLSDSTQASLAALLSCWINGFKAPNPNAVIFTQTLNVRI
jgi:hypothetical protein